AREDHDAPTIERALHDVLDALRDRADRDALLLVDLLRLGLLDVRGRHLDLDDVRAELRGAVCRVGDDVDRGLAFLRESRAARIGPDDDREAGLLRLDREAAELLVHLLYA